MPDLSTVKAAVDAVANNLRGRRDALSARETRGNGNGSKGSRALRIARHTLRVHDRNVERAAGDPAKLRALSGRRAKACALLTAHRLGGIAAVSGLSGALSSTINDLYQNETPALLSGTPKGNDRRAESIGPAQSPAAVGVAGGCCDLSPAVAGLIGAGVAFPLPGGRAVSCQTEPGRLTPVNFYDKRGNFRP